MGGLLCLLGFFQHFLPLLAHAAAPTKAKEAKEHELHFPENTGHRSHTLLLG